MKVRGAGARGGKPCPAASLGAKLRLTDAVFARSHALLREALTGGRQLVRKEVSAALPRGRVATDGLKLRLPNDGRTTVHLLQAYDEDIIGYTESRKVLVVAGQPDAPNGAPMHSNL